MMVGRTLGRYQIVEEIGHGGMGAVYKAWDPVLRRYVAIKVLAPHIANPETAQRFQREASIAADLRHPNIITIYDVGQQEGILYIAMEYVDGRPLSEVIAREGPLPLARLVHILRQVAAALDYAHHLHLVHRDIKPANILVTAEDRVIVTDFGIAKALEGSEATAQLTVTGTILGTPAYISPEQIQGQSVDHRSDLYSLGVVCFEMLSGRPPFGGTTTASVLHAHVYEPPPGIRSLNPNISKQVEAALERMLAKRPQDRFPSASAFVETLASEVDRQSARSSTTLDQPAMIRPPRYPKDRRRLWKSPALLLGLGIISILLIVVALLVRQLTVQRLLVQGNDALVAGQYARAETLFTQVLKKEPKNGVANLGLGEALRRQGKVFESVPCYQMVLTSDDRSSAAHAGLGWAYYSLEQYEQALAEFTRVIALDPARAEGYQGKGLSYYALGRYEEALEPLRTWVEMVPETGGSELSWAYYFTGGYDKAVSGFTRLIRLEPENVAGYEGLAKSYYALEQYQQAEEPLVKWAEMEPDNPEACRLLGWVHYHQQHYAQAAEQFTRAGRLASTNDDIFWGLGNSLSRLGEFEQALIAFERCAELKPNSAVVHDAQAWTLYHLGRYEEAITVFSRALELEETASSYHGLGASYDNLGEWEQALAAFQKWVELDPGNDTSYSSMAWALYRLKRYEEAVTAFSEALKLSETASSYQGLGMSYDNLGEWEEALAAFQKWVELDPGNGTAYSSMAWVLYKLKHYEEAVTAFSEALKLLETASSYQGLGDSYFQLGHYEQALAAFQKWVALEPDKATAYNSVGWTYLLLRDCPKAIVNFQKALQLEPNLSAAQQGLKKCRK